ncbi:hypothetical protein [Streptomyces sp. NRRL WC-3742]|uniref:hypothetical protein n=1 Tax=Streptomyces sp. NRRL WC-3742 TaxID=1463934 RepID=UPI0004CADC2E|nr:hypothetical protein [Streptomyces sp. NRRL WC-3742]
MTADAPPLWFSLPEGFTPVDLEQDPADRVDLVANGVEAAFGAARPDQKLGLVIAAETALQAQLREGAVHLSLCLGRTSDGTVVQGMFAVFVRPEDLGAPGSYPRRAAAQLAEAWPEADVGVLELPIGRTVVAVRNVPVPVPAAVYGTSEPLVSTVRQAEFLIPHPWTSHVIAAVFTTEHVEYWDEWVPTIAGAVRGISFYAPRDETVDDQPPEQWDRIRKAFG